MNEDVGIVEFDGHLVRIGDEVRREIAAVELHTFNDIHFGFCGLGFFNRDHAFIADLLHRIGNHLADERIAIGRDCADLSDFARGLHFLRASLNVLDGDFRCHVDATLQIHRVHAGGDIFHAFTNDGLCENGSGCGAVASDVVRLGSDFAQHLCAHIFELVIKLDVFRNRHTVFRDARSAKRLVDHNVTTLRAERDLYRIGENINATQHSVARVGGEKYLFSSHDIASLNECDQRTRAVRLTCRSRP